MPAPIINSTQSVLCFLQGESFSFQAAATNTPTAWYANGLPGGVTINSSGLMSGASAVPGVFVVSVRAENASGSSEPVLFVIGIEATAASEGTDIDMTVDLVSGTVSLTKPRAPIGTATAESSDDAPAQTDLQKAAGAALLTAKSGRDLIFRVRLVKGGIAQELGMTDFDFSMKEFEAEGILAASDDWVAVGDGATAAYRVHVLLDSAATSALSIALADHDDEDDVDFPGRCEFRWTFLNPDDFGPDTLHGVSQTFFITVAKAQA